jgi:hypothetical protein
MHRRLLFVTILGVFVVPTGLGTGWASDATHPDNLAVGGKTPRRPDLAPAVAPARGDRDPARGGGHMGQAAADAGAVAPNGEAHAVERVKRLCHSVCLTWVTLNAGMTLILIVMTGRRKTKRYLCCWLACAPAGGLLYLVGQFVSEPLSCVGFVAMSLAHMGCATAELVRVVRVQRRRVLSVRSPLSQ